MINNLYIKYKFLLRFSRGHIHSVTTTEVSPDLGEFAEILDNVNVEMIPILYH